MPPIVETFPIVMQVEVTAAGHDRVMAFTSVMFFATLGVVVPPPPPVLAAVWLVQAAATREIAKSVVTTRVLFTSVPLSFAPQPVVLSRLRLGEMLRRRLRPSPATSAFHPPWTVARPGYLLTWLAPIFREHVLAGM
jgi:hypothetical protein